MNKSKKYSDICQMCNFEVEVLPKYSGNMRDAFVQKICTYIATRRPKNSHKSYIDTYQPPFMDIEAVTNLFDLCWFSFEIFKKHSITSPSSTSEAYEGHQNHENSTKANVSHPLAIHTSSKSDPLTNKGYYSVSLSPDSVLFTPHLETIYSGIEDMENVPKTPQPKKDRGKRRKAKKGLSKSLSEFEFEELKGFMDLGFTFCEEDRNSSLVEIIPGLQRLGQKRDGDENDKSVEEFKVARPYLSEAWDVLDRKKIDNPLMKLRFPAMRNENDIKDSLKWWAHTVASRVG